MSSDCSPIEVRHFWFSLIRQVQCNKLPVLQIRGGNKDNLGTVHRDGSNEGSQHRFLLRNKKNYL